MVNGINDVNSGAAYRDTSKVKKEREGSFSEKVLTCTSAGGKKTMLCQDALFSQASFVTGESVNVYKAEGFSAENPVYLVKGVDGRGNEYERTINADEVNPHNCTYLELSVLNVHAGNTKDSFLQMAMIHNRVNGGEESFFDRADYNQAAEATLKEYKTMKAWDSYLRCNTWWQGIMDYYLSK